MKITRCSRSCLDALRHVMEGFERLRNHSTKRVSLGSPKSSSKCGGEGGGGGGRYDHARKQWPRRRSGLGAVTPTHHFVLAVLFFSLTSPLPSHLCDPYQNLALPPPPPTFKRTLATILYTEKTNEGCFIGFKAHAHEVLTVT